MLAALLGALSLFNAAPAQAQTVPTIVLGNSAAPTNLDVAPGDESLTVTWGAPTGNYNRGIWVQYREQGGNWTFSSTSATSPHTISSLTNGTTYDVRVFGVTCCNAENNNLRSPFATGSGTPVEPPPAGTVWQATLNPQEIGTLQFGCNTGAATDAMKCTTTATLTDNGPFTVGGASYSVTAVYNLSNAGSLIVLFDRAPNPALRDLKFCVGSRAFALTGIASSGLVQWTSTGIDWSGRIQVDLKIATTCAAQTVTPTQSSNADLSGLTATSSTFDATAFTALSIGTFSAATTTYLATVPNQVDEVKLRPTVAESNASVEVGKGTTLTAVTSGQDSGAIPLLVGANAITVKVTAQDGTTTKTYTVTVTRAQQVVTPDPNSIKVTLKSSDRDNPTMVTVNEGKKAVLNLGFSGCENNNYVLIPIITTNVLNNQGNPINPPESGWRLSRGASGPRGSPGPDVLSYGPDHGFGHTLTPPVHSCGSGDVYIDTYRDCDIYDEKFTVELGTMPEGYVRGSQYKVTVTIIDDGGQEFCTRTPPPARQPTDQPSSNTEETDTDDGTPVTPTVSGPPTVSAPPTGGGGGGGGLPPSGSSDEPPPEDDELSTLCSQEDRETLGNFYETTGGENWDENENWNSPEPLDQWYGVDTDDAGEVVSLRLSHNALSGEVPTRELLCLSELKELALWGNEEDLSGEVPEELVLAVERAVLRDIAEMLDLNPEWFENYGDPYNFEDWHEGVTTDDDGRVVELDLTGEGVLGEIPESSSELKRLREIMITRSSGGCALNPKDNSSAFSLFLLALLVFAALRRTRARG